MEKFIVRSLLGISFLESFPQSPPPSENLSYKPLYCVLHVDTILFFQTFVYGNLFSYDIKKRDWREIKSPGAPPPRCAHQTVSVPLGGGQLWIFGGEYMSPSQSQFYHYKDLWVYHMKTKRWEKIM